MNVIDKVNKIPDPSYDLDPKWKINDLRSWLHVLYEDLNDYLLYSKAYDGKEMKSFRPL